MAKTKIENGKRVWWKEPPYAPMIAFEVDYRKYKEAKPNKQRFNKSIRWIRCVLLECGFQVPLNEDLTLNGWEYHNFYWGYSYLVSGADCLKASWDKGTLVIEMEDRKKSVEKIADLLDTIREVWSGKVHED